MFLNTFFVAANTLIASASAGPTHEISPSIGFYNGDALRSSVMGGLTYNYHLNETFWFGADFLGGELSVDNPNGLRLKSGEKFLATDAVVSWNVPSVLGAKPENASGGYSADLYTSIGPGFLWLGSRSMPMGVLGGGLFLHLPIDACGSHCGLRFDLKGWFYDLSNAEGADFNFDSILSLGPSFIF